MTLETTLHDTHVTVPKSVATAMVNALIAIDAAAPKTKPAEPEYPEVVGMTEVIAISTAYAIGLTAWSLACCARQALTFAELAAQEPVPEDEDVSTRRFEVS